MRVFLVGWIVDRYRLLSRQHSSIGGENEVMRRISQPVLRPSNMFS